MESESLTPEQSKAADWFLSVQGLIILGVMMQHPEKVEILLDEILEILTTE